MLTPTERQAIMDEVEAGTFDLEDALDDIATEQRGEGVRRAIYGGILCANENGTGAVDAKAREKILMDKIFLEKKIASLEKTMGEFIATNTGTVEATKITETTLFSANTPYKNNQITISEEISEFDYIDVRYAAFGRTGYVRLKPNDISNVAHWTEFENDYTVNVSQSETTDEYTGIRKVTFVLSEYDSDTLICNMYVWRWTGHNTDNGLIAQTIGQSWSVGIYSITGVKYETVTATEKDTELVDLRTGYDGTEYASAGEAIRAQIQAIHDALDSILLSDADVVNDYLRLDTVEDE